MSPLTAREHARNARWLTRCTQVGNELRLHGRPTIEVYGGRIRIGDRFRLASSPVTSHLVAGPDADLDIGNDVSIGHGAAIAAFERVQVGDGTLIGPFVIVMDTNFHGAPGDHSLQHDCRPVIVGKRCRIGSRVTITRGVTIGDDAEILAGSVVSSSIPPGVCAGGARARVFGPAGTIACRWDTVAADLAELYPPASPAAGSLDLDLLDSINRRFGVSIQPSQISNTMNFEDAFAVIVDARKARSWADE